MLFLLAGLIGLSAISAFAAGNGDIPRSSSEPDDNQTSDPMAEPDGKGGMVATEDEGDEAPEDLPDEPVDTSGEVAEEPEVTEADRDLAERAAAVGMTEDDIDQFDSERSLRAAIRLQERRLVRTPEPTRQAEQAPAKPEVKSRKYEMKLPEGMDEELAKALGALNDYYGGQLDEMFGVLNEARESVSTIQNERFFTEFDEFISKLPENWKEVFGEGDGFSMQPGSAAYDNRVRLLQEAAVLQQAYAKSPRRISRGELFKRALSMAFGDRVKQNARREVEAKLAQRRGANAVRPTNRGESADGENRMLAALRKFRIERGLRAP